MNWYDNNKNVSFSDLVDKTLTSIVEDGDTVTFTCDDGTRYQMLHYQDCCESVSVEEVIGDLNDLIGSPILIAEERSDDTPPNDNNSERYADECELWTFYELATFKGSVTIRWYGTSNGYYGVSVDFVQLVN